MSRPITVSELAKTLHQVRAEIKPLRLARYERDLTDLHSQGYVLDLVQEMADCADMDEASFDKHRERIKRSYTKGDPKAPSGELGEEDLDKILRYQREHKITGEDAFEKARAGAARV